MDNITSALLEVCDDNEEYEAIIILNNERETQRI